MKEQINDLLDANPELTSFQKEIDKVLKGAGNDPIARGKALNLMITDNMQMLSSNLQSLLTTLVLANHKGTEQ